MLCVLLFCLFVCFIVNLFLSLQAGRSSRGPAARGKSKSSVKDFFSSIVSRVDDVSSRFDIWTDVAQLIPCLPHCLVIKPTELHTSFHFCLFLLSLVSAGWVCFEILKRERNVNSSKKKEKQKVERQKITLWLEPRRMLPWRWKAEVKN